MSNFVYLYNFNGITVLYYSIINIHDLIYKINHYIGNSKDVLENNMVYIITNCNTGNIDFDFIKEKNIILLQTNINFDLFFNLHILRHDYYYKNNVNTENILELYNKISVPFENYPNTACYSSRNRIFNTIKDNINTQNIAIQNIKKFDKENNVYEIIIQSPSVLLEKVDFYNKLLNDINDFLNENINCFKNKIVDFKEFARLYNFENDRLIKANHILNNIILENVYYINKQWYDQSKNLIDVPEFYQDFEYIGYKNHYENKRWENAILDITNVSIFQEIKEEVMFLDYLYGFYNFGEFWDVIKRLIVSKKKNIPLFHLKNNRITNIEYYFEKLQFVYPSNYLKCERNNKLYFFHKININILKNVSYRGGIDKYFAYQFNKLLNPSLESEKSYNVYLSRGENGRSIINEEQILNVLKNKYNFIVLNGRESLEQTIYYFTNAKIILGAHGSLMKNMIWCNNNPLLIELCPPTRHDCFYNNSTTLGFTTFFILTNCHEKEIITLNDDQKDNLFKLLDTLVPQ